MTKNSDSNTPGARRERPWRLSVPHPCPKCDWSCSHIGYICTLILLKGFLQIASGFDIQHASTITSGNVHVQEPLFARRNLRILYTLKDLHAL